MLSANYVLKEQSHRLILNFIRIHHQISGAQLARLSGLQPSTIVYILRALKKRRLIRIKGTGVSSNSGGKPPTLWGLNEKAGFLFGLEIIPEEVRISVLDFAGNTVYQSCNRNGQEMYGENVVDGLVQLIKKVLLQLKIPSSKVIGIAIAISGWVDTEQGIVLHSRHLNIDHLPLIRILKERLAIPVAITNDAKAGALGVQWYSEVTETMPANITYLTINEIIHGYGAGLIVHNKLYEGLAGIAGTMHMAFPAVGELADKGIKLFGADHPAVRLKSEKTQLHISDAESCFQDGCRISQYILDILSTHIANDIIQLMLFMNSEFIVIGGDLTQNKLFIRDFLQSKLEEKIQENGLTGLPIPNLVFSPFGIYSVSQGATALILREIFSINP